MLGLEGSSYIQVDDEIQEFLNDYPKANFGRRNEFGNYEVNDGNTFLMVAYDYAKMAGVDVDNTDIF